MIQNGIRGSTAVSSLLLESHFGNDWIPVARLEAGVTGYLDQNLYCGIKYEYRLAASNASGNSAYVTQDATTAACLGYGLYLPLVVRGGP